MEPTSQTLPLEAASQHCRAAEIAEEVTEEVSPTQLVLSFQDTFSPFFFGSPNNRMMKVWALGGTRLNGLLPK